MTIGERIKEIRLYKKFMTREELAQSLNCSQSTICAWESNTSLPQLPAFLKLLNVFHISCEEFMKGVEIE
ncbi:helix-turn-helix transcriptional regulator [Ruminococcus sp. M6(2020)]|uniref:Helix-turn-helix transcriptional regulator n=2 Tax=Ruminococcus difficilis TaxID=2763069 RepID=A0A934WTI1_9FIRM|nr:helix-turn-helix transcriptional regulator [Ruminococcus difficilis]